MKSFALITALLALWTAAFPSQTTRSRIGAGNLAKSFSGHDHKHEGHVQPVRRWPPHWVDADAYNADPNNALNQIPESIMTNDPDIYSSHGYVLVQHTRDEIFAAMRAGVLIIEAGLQNAVPFNRRWPRAVTGREVPVVRTGHASFRTQDPDIRWMQYPLDPANAYHSDRVVFARRGANSDQWWYVGVISLEPRDSDPPATNNNRRLHWGWVPNALGLIDGGAMADPRYPGLDNNDLNALNRDMAAAAAGADMGEGYVDAWAFGGLPGPGAGRRAMPIYDQNGNLVPEDLVCEPDLPNPFWNFGHWGGGPGDYGGGPGAGCA